MKAKQTYLAGLLIALPLLVASGIPGAMPSAPQYRPASPALGTVIADQGNRALRQIQAEAVSLPAPQLPPLAAVESR